MVWVVGFEPTASCFQSRPSDRTDITPRLLCRSGRSYRIRTCDPLIPNQMRYRAALSSELEQHLSDYLVSTAKSNYSRVIPFLLDATYRTSLHRLDRAHSLIGFNDSPMFGVSALSPTLTWLPSSPYSLAPKSAQSGTAMPDPRSRYSLPRPPSRPGR